MATNRAKTGKMEKMEKMERHVVPSDCGPLADALYAAIQRGDGGETIRHIRTDIMTAALWLADVPEDTLIRDIDILSEFGWTDDAQAEIRAA